MPHTRGKAFDPTYLGSWIAEAIDEAGLPDDCDLHGLRKTASQWLADASCSDREIMAFTGHRTARMATEYTKTAEIKKRASAAILKLENAKESGGAKRQHRRLPNIRRRINIPIRFYGGPYGSRTRLFRLKI